MVSSGKITSVAVFETDGGSAIGDALFMCLIISQQLIIGHGLQSQTGAMELPAFNGI